MKLIQRTSLLPQSALPNWRAWILAAMTVMLSLPAGAQIIPGYPDALEAFDAREVAMLPNYCKYTQVYRQHVPGGDNELEVQKWYRTLGPTFHHLHHYCNGLMRTHRALFLARTQQAKRFNLDASIGEFDYVIQRAPRDFVLLPEILTKKGENQIKLGQGQAGVKTLLDSIALKPDYWPPYAALADFYAEAGDKAKAREVLQRGLAAAPDAPALTRRMNELASTSGTTRR